MMMRRAKWFLMSFPMLWVVGQQQRVKLWYVDVRTFCYRWSGDTGVEADMIQTQCNQEVTGSQLFSIKRPVYWEGRS